MVHLSSWQRRFAAHLLLYRHSSALGPLAASAGIRTRVTIHGGTQSRDSSLVIHLPARQSVCYANPVRPVLT